MKSNMKRIYLLVLVLSILVLAVLVFVFPRFTGVAGVGNTSYPVRIAEVMTSNTMYPNDDGVCCDYITLYNSASYSIRIGGYRLSDGSNYYVFPSDTVIKGDTYLTVFCSKDFDGAFYAPFGLSSEGGETISLTTSKGAVLDSLSTVALERDSVMVFTDQQWDISPSPVYGICHEEADNVFQPSVVTINEILQSNASYPNENGEVLDFIELYNSGDTAISLAGWVLTDNAKENRYVFPENCTLDAHGYLVIYCSNERTGFSLSVKGEETILLKDSSGTLCDFVTTVSAETDMAYGRLADGSFSLLSYATPGFENTEAGLDAWCAANGYTGQSVYMTELMAANRSTTADAFGEFSDWVEFSNISSEAICLKGWYLTNEEDVPFKWAFPEVTVEPGQIILVYCSGRDTVIDGEIHASFRLSASGEALFLVAPGGRITDSVSYQNAQEDRSFLIDPLSGSVTETVYPTPGYSNDTAGYEAFCSARSTPNGLAIWEVMVSNDRYLAQDGMAYDWVELKNCSDSPIVLSNWSISDSRGNPYRHTLPDVTLKPGEYYVVMLSGDTSLTGKYNHADFSLSAAEDTLYLFENGTLRDYVHLIDIPNLETYGRLDGQSGFFYMTPSPLKENVSGSRRICDMPEPSLKAGVYLETDSLTVTLSGNGTIYYTLDGSTPTASSNVYDSPIVLAKATVLRAISSEAGKRDSMIMTASYLINTEHSIPIVSLTADPSSLFGSNGIYKSNWSIKEIEIPANISYYGSDGSFALDCGLSMHGMTSLLVSNKKSFTVRFRNNYDGPLHYDIFGDNEISTYYSILLRADVENVVSTMMHDNLFGALASEYSDSLMGMKYKYVALYINGEYWGTYSIREHFSTEYYASHLGCSIDECTMLKGFSLLGDELYEVRRFMENNSLSNPDNYAYVCTKLDVVSFADWIIFEAYSGNIDVNGNMRYFYSESDGLWRCAICDVDLGMTTARESKTWSIPLYALQHGAMMRRLFLSSEFQQLFLERLSYWLNGPLRYENMCARIDAMAAQLEPELEKEAARWSDFKISYWNGYVKLIKTHCKYRGTDLIYSLSECKIYLTSDERDKYFGDIL